MYTKSIYKKKYYWKETLETLISENFYPKCLGPFFNTTVLILTSNDLWKFLKQYTYDGSGKLKYTLLYGSMILSKHKNLKIIINGMKFKIKKIKNKNIRILINILYDYKLIVSARCCTELLELIPFL